jgi:hypothetical protein
LPRPLTRRSKLVANFLMRVWRKFAASLPRCGKFFDASLKHICRELATSSTDCLLQHWRDHTAYLKESLQMLGLTKIRTHDLIWHNVVI